VVCGEAGIGKTALLEHLVEHASGCRVVRAAGIQAEMELAFAGLHQLLASLLGALEHMPPPQRDAMRTAFGLAAGPPPDPFILALAVLTLLSEVAAERPLLCIVDDEQWLDRASSQALAFAARRLGTESVGLVFAARKPSDSVASLPMLNVKALDDAAAGALLDRALGSPLDPVVRDAIVAEAAGNPLCLLEVAHSSTPAELAGGFGVPGPNTTLASAEETFRRQIAELPSDTRHLMQIAAADPVGDPLLVWRAAAQLQLGRDAASAAVDAGLIEIGTRVLFHHPLVRSAAYYSATTDERRVAHAALAAATDPHADPDRRAWHLAHAAARPDAGVAMELERSAERARVRGGWAAAAAFLEQAARLTPEPRGRARRLLDAASAKCDAGAVEDSAALLAAIDPDELDEDLQVQADLVRAHLAFASDRGGDAPALLLRAARRLEPLDAAMARDTYLEAIAAAMFAGRLARPEGGEAQAARAARLAPAAPDPLRPTELMLDGFAAHFTAGYAAGAPRLRRALMVFGTDMSSQEQLRWLWLASVGAIHLWDDGTWERLSERHIRLVRETGALRELPLALSSRTYVHLFTGELGLAASLVDETADATAASGSKITPYGALGLAALSGDEDETARLFEIANRDAARRGEGIGITVAEWARAILNNALGRHDDALAAARNATSCPTDVGSANWAAVELIESLARTGQRSAARDACRRISEITRAAGTEWALGIQARSRALVVEGLEAEALFRESIEHLSRTRVRLELARTHLLLGEWLAGERRRTAAREALHTAREMFEQMGAAAFGERARRGLLANGDTLDHRPRRPSRELSPQEARIARLAGDGLSNPEIGERLFVSSRTVQYHLSKVYAKLGVSSRHQLGGALGGDSARAPSRSVAHRR
jgi:DNA-binding CsgD family transcriptional regulator